MTKKKSATPAQKPSAAPVAALTDRKKKKCRAREVGHRRCNCGSEHCGPNIAEL
jgi:hypothetical protein